jgi:hypothetical protein
MTRFRRRGHWRRGRNGELHWVSAHSVNRVGAPRGRRPARVRPAPRTRPDRSSVPSHPNATCPVCGAQVWFFRHKNGGCAYFDALGVPWPKHPCIDQSSPRDLLAAFEARRLYDGRRERRSARQVVQLRQEKWWTRSAVERTEVRGAERRGGRPRNANDRGVSRPFPSWWLAFSSLLAWLESLPLSIMSLPIHGRAPAGGTAMPLAAWIWFVLVATLLTGPALVAFLKCTPRPKVTAVGLIGSILASPLLWIAAAIGNVVTLGLALPFFTIVLVRRVRAAVPAIAITRDERFWLGSRSSSDPRR